MKAIKFFVATVLVAILPAIFTSCEEKKTPTVVGTWEVIEATVAYGSSQPYETEEVGQIWKFDEVGALTVEGNVCEYTEVDSKLITSYAELYQADHFVIKELTWENMTIAASYVKETKVGKEVITYTFKMKRLSE